jgi:preprotein translocase subunit SecE
MAKLTQYLTDVNEEMKKVNWPTWAHLKNSTNVVIFVSLILAFTVYFFDWILNRAIGFIL